MASCGPIDVFSAASRDTFGRLYLDLAHPTLDDMSQPKLLSVARVSRRWREVAGGHPNFYVLVQIVTDR